MGQNTFPLVLILWEKNTCVEQHEPNYPKMSKLLSSGYLYSDYTSFRFCTYEWKNARDAFGNRQFNADFGISAQMGRWLPKTALVPEVF